MSKRRCSEIATAASSTSPSSAPTLYERTKSMNGRILEHGRFIIPPGTLDMTQRHVFLMNVSLVYPHLNLSNMQVVVTSRNPETRRMQSASWLERTWASFTGGGLQLQLQHPKIHVQAKLILREPQTGARKIITQGDVVKATINDGSGGTMWAYPVKIAVMSLNRVLGEESDELLWSDEEKLPAAKRMRLARSAENIIVMN